LFEWRGVEFEGVEKIAIEVDGQIGIVANLAGMTELNLVDDSSKNRRCLPPGLSDPAVLRAHGAALRIALALHPEKTVS